MVIYRFGKIANIISLLLTNESRKITVLHNLYLQAKEILKKLVCAVIKSRSPLSFAIFILKPKQYWFTKVKLT